MHAPVADVTDADGSQASSDAEPDAPVDWSGLPAPHPRLRCTVVLPVRNEGRLIERTLRALADQDEVAADAFEVLVLANNCSDDSAAQARQVADGARCRILVVEAALPPPFDNVGAARRALMEQAAERLSGVAHDAPSPAVILSTDGDTQVDRDWVAANLREIDAGADAVGGLIRTEDDAAWPAGLLRIQRLDRAYCLLRSKHESQVDPADADPWPRHHHHFGASLAVRLTAYRRVGGLPRVRFLEDVALIDRLAQADCRIRHSPQVRVRTSGRLDGRAEVGLSWQLRQWSEDAALPARMVTDPHEEARWWALRREARRAWAAHAAAGADAAAAPPSMPELAAAVSRDSAWLRQAFADAPTFGALWEGLLAAARESGPPAPPLPFPTALTLLRGATRAG